MQKFSKEELQPQAEKFMEAHRVDSFMATEDGNFFHPKDRNLAKDHNAKNVKGEVIEFTKEVTASEPPADDPPADEPPADEPPADEPPADEE